MKASYEQLCNIIIKNPSIETVEQLKNKASSEGFTEATEYDLDLAIGWSMQARQSPLIKVKGNKMKQFVKDFIHNVIVHPLMMVLPSKQAAKLHDTNADWAFGKDTRLNEIDIEKGNIIFIIEASEGYDESPKLIGVWKSLPDAIDNCKESNPDNKWSLDYYVVSEQKINSNDKGKTVFTKSFNWESGKWDENFLNQS